jgi:hypothetical protein
MKKPLIIIILTLVSIVAIIYFKAENKYDSAEVKINIASMGADGYKNTSYILDGEEIIMKNGVAETESAPGSAMKKTTTYFGNEVKYDFNKDGRKDMAFLVSQETGGTGVFFYIVVALNTQTGYKGTEGFFIGDRIAPQTTNIEENGTMIVNYVDRAVDEGLTAEPSIGKSLRLVFDREDKVLKEVVEN